MNALYALVGAIGGFLTTLLILGSMSVVSCGINDALGTAVIGAIFLFPIPIAATIIGGVLGYKFKKRAAFVFAVILALGGIGLAIGNAMPHLDPSACRIDL